MAIERRYLEGFVPQALMAACDHLGEAMVIIDGGRHVRYMNRTARALVGDPPGPRRPAATCSALLRCGPPEAPGAACGNCWGAAALRQGVATSHFETAVGPDGARVWVEGSCTPVPGTRPHAVLLLRPRFHLPAGVPAAREEHLDPLTEPGRRVLRSLVQAARELLSADYAALGRVDVDASEVAWLVQDGNRSSRTAGTRVRLGQGIRGRVVSLGRPLRIARFPEDAPDPPEKHPTMRSERLKAALAVPVTVRSEPAGVLMVASRRPVEYGPEHERVLRVLAGLAGEVLSDAEWALSAQAASVRAEREWLAAELHDGLAQLLATLTQKLKLVRWLLGGAPDPAALAAQFEEVLDLSEKAHRELRLALGDLLAPAAGGDLLPALQEYLGRFARQTGLDVRLVEAPAHRPHVPAPVALQILRVVQEAVTNARKHSGGSRVEVRWTFTGTLHTFTVTDDGRGFVPEHAGGGFGLAIMAERARRVGGALTVTSAPGSGCTVVLTVPHR